MVRTQYVSSAHINQPEYWNSWRKANDYEKEKWPDEGQPDMSILYETKDGKFGTKIAVNSQGRFVLEMKGTGEVAVFDEKDLEEVVPYTVRLYDLFEEQPSHVQIAQEAGVVVGDLLMSGRKFYRVEEVNTKNRSARKLSGLRRLVTEEL
jgi:hypothetical protein